MKTSEDAVVAKVGRELYELFFRGYTRKQWERDPSELHASVCARIPIRTGTEDRYFTDTFQQMPREGYTSMFERMLDGHRGAHGTDFDDVRDEVEYDHLVYTGPIDEFFGHRFGKLPYRVARVRALRRAHAGRRPRQPAARATSRASTCPTRARPSTGT
jgi:UDP-galactopyranose mutase